MRPSTLPQQHLSPWNLASEPEVWGQGNLVRAGTAPGVQVRLLQLKNVSPDGRPQRVVVATQALSARTGGPNNEGLVCHIKPGVGGIKQDYTIDAGSALAVNCDALEVTAEVQVIQPVDANVLATVSRGGEALGRLSGGAQNLAPGGVATGDVPFAADAVSLVVEYATADLDIRLLGRLGVATPLWQTTATDLNALHQIPIGPQPVSLRIALGAGAPASCRVWWQWRIRA